MKSDNPSIAQSRAAVNSQRVQARERLAFNAEISPGARFIYFALDILAGNRGRTEPITKEDLAAKCGVAVRSVFRWVRELEARGYVRQSRGRYSCYYEMLWRQL